jgi:hypothetical protein
MAPVNLCHAASSSSLRGAERRSNPAAACVAMDCFATLAMTWTCPASDKFIPNPAHRFAIHARTTGNTKAEASPRPSSPRKRGPSKRGCRGSKCGIARCTSGPPGDAAAYWVPAFAGMTSVRVAMKRDNRCVNRSARIPDHSAGSAIDTASRPASTGASRIGRKSAQRFCAKRCASK